MNCTKHKKLTLLILLEMQHDLGEALKQQRSKMNEKEELNEGFVLPGLFTKN